MTKKQFQTIRFLRVFIIVLTMAKIKDSDAEARMYKNVFVCMKCNAKRRAKSKVNLLCRKCGSNNMRNKKKAAKK